MFLHRPLSLLTLGACAALSVSAVTVVATTASAAPSAKGSGYQTLSQAQLHSPSGARRAGGRKH